MEHGNRMETRGSGISRAKTGAFALCVFLSALGCSGTEPEEPGAVRGRFVQDIARFGEERSDVTYTLFRGTDRSDRRELVFKKAPDLISNTEIKVWGTEAAGRINVDRYEVVGEAPKKGPL